MPQFYIDITKHMYGGALTSVHSVDGMLSGILVAVGLHLFILVMDEGMMKYHDICYFQAMLS